MNKQRLLAIVGPTAVGKTAVTLVCARLLGGEIVSADSMQVYRGMDIGTAKPTPEEMAAVPHHLIDVVDPDADFSVGLYKEMAETAIEDIFRRGRQPILVGGSGMYVRAITGTWGMTRAPKDEALRERLREEARTAGLPALHARLAAVDPDAATRIPPADEKRIIRALEVYELTGTTINQFHQLDQQKEPAYDTCMVGLTIPRADLNARIETRIDQMMQAGLLDEVARLRAAGYDSHHTSMKAIGYSHLLSYLNGDLDLDETLRLFKRDTRRFAKRQMTWFRAEPEIRWVDVQHRMPAEVAEIIVQEFIASR
jgi:tRNA dimethylallyltransferase